MSKHSYVMMIDDDNSVLNLISRVFEIEGYPDASSVAREMLSRLKEAKPNLVILDLEAPEIESDDSLEKLGERGETPVILLTAQCEIASLKNALSACAGLPTPRSSSTLSTNLLAGLKEVRPHHIPSN